jgi:hypothetical protein
MGLNAGKAAGDVIREPKTCRSRSSKSKASPAVAVSESRRPWSPTAGTRVVRMKRGSRRTRSWAAFRVLITGPQGFQRSVVFAIER